MYVMKTSEENNSSFLFNLITLLTFGLALFLIIFLKQKKSKETDHVVFDENEEEGRVKISHNKITLDLSLNERQMKILERIRQEGRMDPSEIYSLIPNVSTRTIRRDMDVLVGKGIVSQEGLTKSTSYIYTPS